jgi:5-methylcytosine-specific restriction endonuclease McrA
MQRTGYPKGRKGYEVDHITPLWKGGCDTQENLQWLEKDEHRLKSIKENNR